MFIRVWEYEVSAANIEAFTAAYGSDGDWAQLFQRGPGYVGTELYRRVEDRAHFVTVDRWVDHEAWRAFIREWGEAYEELDARMKDLPTSQRSLSEGTS